MPDKTIDDNWPLQNHSEVIATIKAIVAAAERLTRFESEFLAEVLRLALRFKTDMRLSPKQVRKLDEIHTQYVLPNLITNLSDKSQRDTDHA